MLAQELYNRQHVAGQPDYLQNLGLIGDISCSIFGCRHHDGDGGQGGLSGGVSHSIFGGEHYGLQEMYNRKKVAGEPDYLQNLGLISDISCSIFGCEHDYLMQLYNRQHVAGQPDYLQNLTADPLSEGIHHLSDGSIINIIG